jgi:hypothetical protein
MANGPRSDGYITPRLRAHTIGAKTGKLTRVERADLVPYPEDVERPRTRGECTGGQRPCPWVSCKHHLYLDVSPLGGLKLNFPDIDLGEIAETCSLDVADRGGVTLEDVGEVVNVSRERARQIEVRACERIRQAIEDGAPIDPPDDVDY